MACKLGTTAERCLSSSSSALGPLAVVRASKTAINPHLLHLGAVDHVLDGFMQHKHGMERAPSTKIGDNPAQQKLHTLTTNIVRG